MYQDRALGRTPRAGVIGLGPAAAAAHPDSAVYIHCSSSSQPGALRFSGCVDAAPGRCCVPITGNFVIARPREPCSSSYRSDLRMKRIYEVGSAAERRRRRIPAAKKLHETIIYRVDKIRGRAGPGRRELSAVHRRVDIYRTTKTEAAAAARKRVAAGAARHGRRKEGLSDGVGSRQQRRTSVSSSLGGDICSSGGSGSGGGGGACCVVDQRATPASFSSCCIRSACHEKAAVEKL